MDNEKIKELASELAERLYNDDEAYNAILWWGNEPKERKAEELELTLKFLMETHCIVPKTTLDKHYTEMAKDYAMYLDPDNKANREMIEVDSLGFLNWVMAKYCIVEKRNF